MAAGECYEIRIQGHLDERWSAWFDGLAVAAGEGSETILSGLIRDQAALHGVLAKVRDLGLPLIAVNRIEGCPHSKAQRACPKPARSASSASGGPQSAARC